MYEEHTLATGRVVHIRPLPYDQFEEIEDLRLKQMEESVRLYEENKPTRGSMVVLALERDVRRRKLGACVQDFDTLRADMSITDVRQIEGIIDRVSFAEAVRENLSEAGDGPATTSE